MNVKDFKDINKGKSCFVVGNGPSLKDMDLSRIKDKYSFAMNRISLIYPTTDWRPTYFVCVTSNTHKPAWRKDIVTSINLGIPSFVWHSLVPVLPQRDNIIPINCTHGHYVVPKAEDKWWSNDLSIRACKFGTSLLVALQAAVYMGFSSIYLIGCDLGFTDNIRGGDTNHFDPSYGTPGLAARELNINMVAAHELARRSADKLGVKIYNATLGGSLEVYERVDFNYALTKVDRKNS